VSSKKARFASLIQKKDEQPKESQSKKEIFDASIHTSIDATVDANHENDVQAKVEAYKKKIDLKRKQLTHNKMYQQQNVYIDRNIVAAVNKVLKKNKMTKQELYNEALKLYLDVVHDVQVKMKSEE
jgi:hypothetical protein